MTQTKILLKCISSPQKIEIFRDNCLRKVPRKRNVHEGRWGDKEIIIKEFLHPFHGQRHMKREWQKLGKLKERGIVCPTPLLHGQSSEKKWCLVTEKITQVKSAKEIWEKYNSNIIDKIKFMKNIVALVAQHHQKKIIQKDLHLDNFLVADTKIYTLDPTQISFFYSEISKKRCFQNLAVLLSQDLCLAKSINELISEYSQIRHWSLSTKEQNYVHSQIAKYKNMRISKTLRKYHRQNSKHHYIKTSTIKAILDVSLGTKQQMYDLMDNIESLMNQGIFLKEGGTAYIAKAVWNDKDVIIKRYNYKNIWYSIRQTFKNRRGQNSWRSAHHLLLLGVPTPQPLAYIEEYKWGIFQKSYIIMEYIPHQTFNLYFQDQKISLETKQDTAQKVKQLLNQLHTHHISHGDLKYMNILINGTEPILIDLDSMIFHHNLYKYSDKRKKDIQRFLANIKQFPHLQPFFGEQNAQDYQGLYP